jgi:hypothetical protein
MREPEDAKWAPAREKVRRMLARADAARGVTPPDPDKNLRGFVAAVTAPAARERDGGWLGGIREYIQDAGPVPSSRFL